LSTETEPDLLANKDHEEWRYDADHVDGGTMALIVGEAKESTPIARLVVALLQ
jgi:hypothetical protein